MREKRKLRLFENMVLRRIFGPRSDEVTGDFLTTKYKFFESLRCVENLLPMTAYVSVYA